MTSETHTKTHYNQISKIKGKHRILKAVRQKETSHIRASHKLVNIFLIKNIGGQMAVS